MALCCRLGFIEDDVTDIVDADGLSQPDRRAVDAT